MEFVHSSYYSIYNFFIDILGIRSFFIKDNKTVFTIEVLYVASAIFDITWLFYGLENFKSVVIKNALIKIFECICVFIFVETAE